MTNAASDEARAMVRPLRTYDALHAIGPREGDARTALAKAFFTLVVIGAFVSVTAAGRFVLAHVAFTVVFWSFIPVLQIIAVAVVVRLVAKDRSIAFALRAYFVGHGPWFLLLVVLAGVCLFSADVYASMMRLLSSGILPGLLALALVWGGFLTWACFRRALGLPRGRAAAATALFYVFYFGAIASYYHLTDQIRPQFFGAPA